MDYGVKISISKRFSDFMTRVQRQYRRLQARQVVGHRRPDNGRINAVMFMPDDMSDRFDVPTTEYFATTSPG